MLNDQHLLRQPFGNYKNFDVDLNLALFLSVNIQDNITNSSTLFQIALVFHHRYNQIPHHK